jgi:crossover junction endodeoxyribonuclease RusA
MIERFIPGSPKPQGSKRFVGGAMVESCKELPSWREAIRGRLIDENGQPIGRFFDGVAVEVTLGFVMPRPKSTPKKRTPPAIKRPDLDKLTRAACDAIVSSGVVADDAAIVRLLAWKRLAKVDETVGLWIRLESWEARQDETATVPARLNGGKGEDGADLLGDRGSFRFP